MNDAEYISKLVADIYVNMVTGNVAQAGTISDVDLRYYARKAINAAAQFDIVLSEITKENKK